METSQITLSFANVSGKKIEADFDGGTTTSDGGVLLLRQAEARTGIVNRLVGAMSDRRHQSYIDHTYTDLIRQRVFQIACGYEDARDARADKSAVTVSTTGRPTQWRQQAATTQPRAAR